MFGWTDPTVKTARDEKKPKVEIQDDKTEKLRSYVDALTPKIRKHIPSTDTSPRDYYYRRALHLRPKPYRRTSL